MENVRWGILGVSKHFLTRVLPPMLSSEVSIPYAIASRNKERAQATADKYGISQAYGSYEDILADDSIEAVYIPLPNNLHLEWIKKAADAGKHILCEKPLALNADEAREAVDYASEKDVMLAEAFMYKYQPRWQHVQSIITSGGIGKVTGVQIYFAYKNTDPSNIRNIIEAGGGALYDIGCYAVSTARFVFDDEPDRVMSLLRRDKTFGTDVLSSGLLNFDEGHAIFTVGTQTFGRQEVVITGTGGSITVPLPYNAYNDVPSSITVTTGLGTREVEFDIDDQYGLQMDDFSIAIREESEPLVSADDAVSNIAVLDALFRSEQSGAWETV